MSDSKPTYTPSEAELEILQVLWENQPCSVREVHEPLSQHKKVGYTTTLKQMQRMTDKGLIQRVGEGSPHQYEALVRENEVQNNLFRRLLNTAFKGSAMELVMHALGETQTNPDEIAELEAWLEQQKKQSDE
jgi:BlaI family penicillinase repressor